MPPNVKSSFAGSLFDFAGLVQSLPVVSQNQISTKCRACLFSTSQIQQSRTKRKLPRRYDPYREAQAKQRKAANIARQAVLKQERQDAMGDPIRSRPTSFIDSLRATPIVEANHPSHLNYYVKSRDLQDSLQYSAWLTEPIAEENDPQRVEAEKARYQNAHENASNALRSITSLRNASGKDRTRVNIQRCIEEFGRHNTDPVLPPKPASLANTRMKQTGDLTAINTDETASENLELFHRAGPDTGSSEVQVAVLTAKINALADNLGKKDKHNKRNLRLLVHKRQKLLSYLRRKERGGPRWEHLVEKLGVGDAMWKGEISL